MIKWNRKQWAFVGGLAAMFVTAAGTGALTVHGIVLVSAWAFNS
jgi:hypothetical protein